MAKMRAGAMVGQISGSVGIQTFSHNRYGSYVRLRTSPVISQTTYAQQAKARFAAASQAFGGLTAAQRDAWATWAAVNPITDRIGDKQVLDPHAAYVKLNCRQAIQGGAVLSLPPVGNAPDALLTLTGTWDIGAGTFELAFTPTPIGATNRLWIWAAVVNSAGVEYVKNLYKLVAVSALNQATAYDTEALIESRFGTLQVGQFVHILAQVSDNATGLQSIGAPVVGQVVSTP